MSKARRGAVAAERGAPFLRSFSSFTSYLSMSSWISARCFCSFDTAYALYFSCFSVHLLSQLVSSSSLPLSPMSSSGGLAAM